MPVGRAVGEHHVRAELLKPGPAVGAGVVRIDQAADADEIARLKLADGRTHLGDSADDLVARHAWIDGGHHVVPLVTDVMKVRVANAAEQNFDLHVAFRRIASRDRGGGQRRCRAGGGVSFRVVRGSMHGSSYL